MIRYGIWLKVEVQVAGLAPALGIDCGRKRGDKDKSEFGMSNRVNGIIIFLYGGTLGKKQTFPTVEVQFGVCHD